MPIPVRTSQAQLARINERFRRELGVDTTTQGKAARTLIKSMQDALTGTSTILRDGFNSLFVSRASGQLLDFIGETFNLSRLRNTRAFSNQADSNVVISSLRGPLRPLLGNVLPANTEFTDATGSRKFFTPVDVVIPEDLREVAIPVVAFDGGDLNNLTAGELTVHSLGTSIQVTNRFPINGGLDIETDANFRSRIVQHFQGLNTGNSASIRAALLTLSGIDEIIIVQNARGIGTAGFLLIPVGNVLPVQVIENARQLAQSLSSAGLEPIILSPRYLPIAIDAVVEFDSRPPQADISTILENATNLLLSELAIVPVGGRFHIQDAYRNIIVGLGRPIINIETICLKVNGKEVISGVIRLEDDQLLIPANINKPINFVAGG